MSIFCLDSAEMKVCFASREEGVDGGEEDGTGVRGAGIRLESGALRHQLKL